MSDKQSIPALKLSPVRQRDQENARLATISDVLHRGEDLSVFEARWLLARLLSTRCELDYAQGRIELYRKVEEWMKQQ